MHNTYELRTISDIVSVVDESNIEDFLEDFGNWLRFTQAARSVGLETCNPSVMRWIDDGKHDAYITIHA